MEEFSTNCGFILTCNYPKKIIEPLHSRCSVIDFSFDQGEKLQMGRDFIARIVDILESRGISYERSIIADLVMDHLPDWRRIYNELQRYSVTGSIDEAILNKVEDAVFDSLKRYIISGDVKGIRRWVRANENIEPITLFLRIDDASSNLCRDDQKKMKSVMKTLSQYQYQSTSIVSQRMNTQSCLVEVMEICNSHIKTYKKVRSS